MTMTPASTASPSKRIFHRQLDELAAEPSGKFTLGEVHRLYQISTLQFLRPVDLEYVEGIYCKQFPHRDPKTGQQEPHPTLLNTHTTK